MTKRSRFVPKAPLALAVCLLFLAISSAAGAGAIVVRGERIAVHRDAGVDYVPLYRIVEVVGGKFWRVNDRFVAVLPGDSLGGSSRAASTCPETEYVFWAESSLVRCAEREVRLPVVPMMDGGQLYLPVLGLPVMFPGVVTDLPTLVGIEVDGYGDTALICLRSDGTDSLSWVGESRSSLEYRLVAGASCDSVMAEQLALTSILAPNGLVQSAHVDTGAGTAVHFMFRRPALVTASSKGRELVVRMWPRPEQRIRRVVIDPGHGGKDPGAVGPGGTLEKDIVLDVGKRLQQELEVEGYEVSVTRNRDEYVPLAARSKFANDKKADLFISIHANASENRNACGFETYFLSEAKSDWERAVAARENASLKLEMADTTTLVDELELILADMAQNEYLTEASELAERIQVKSVPHARIMDRGVRQANFFVLRNNYMPAVLVEVGFISNRSEEKLLREPTHRQKLAEGVSRGIVDFIAEYEQRINGS